MAESRYEMCVRERQTGRIVAAWPPGMQQERDFVASVVENARAKGVGWFKSEEVVVNALRNALDEAIYALKSSVKP